jgi:subtilisin family serine protease
MSRSWRAARFLASLLLTALAVPAHGAPALAAPAGAAGPPGRDGLVGVIVKLEDAPLARYRGGLPGLPPTARAATGAARLDARSPRSRAYLAHLDGRLAAFEAAARAAIPRARAVHRYRAVLGAVALRVPEGDVAGLAALPGVEAVYPDELAQLHTERGPAFIGAPRVWRQLGGIGSAGEGVVVGVLDTGIWPEHPSFADPDPLGRPYPPPPATYNGGAGPECEPAVTGPALTCNNKLVGAFKFLDTYLASFSLLPGELDSPRDTDGHGTHTASTAAGNAGVQTGIAKKPISGVAPRAHVAAYRVCADLGCFTSDSAAAIDQAVLDGVDVINFSISGGTSPYSDPVSLAFLDAYEAGVFVAASAGNGGPAANTVNHRAPWVATVAASTHNRQFQTTLALRGLQPGRFKAKGASLTSGIGTATPVVLAASFGDPRCLDPFAPGTFGGTIVVCERGINARVAKGFNVQQGGASGMILYNPSFLGVATDNHFVPSVHLEAGDAVGLLGYLATHTGVTGTFKDGKAARTKGDVVAPFSSRGGPGLTLGIAKPDVTAPGVQILAGDTPVKHAIDSGAPGLFQAIQGTSMSSPHVAGAAALLKDLHPDWTPGQIKSALMTTATRRRLFKEDGQTLANGFDVGSGRIDLKRAAAPGLTFDETAASYVTLASQLWNANYPSIYLPNPSFPQVLLSRTARNVEEKDRTYRINIRVPPGSPLFVATLPEKQLFVPAGGDAPFLIGIDALFVPSGQVATAAIELKGGGRRVHLPIIVKRP